MFSRTGPSNLLNKIQFTFEVVPRPFQTIFPKVYINFSPVLQGGGWEGGGEEWVRRGGGEGGGKTSPGEDTR